MINPFERFYDTEIEVYEVGENTYEKKGEKIVLLISNVNEEFVKNIEEKILATFDNKLMIPSIIKIVNEIPKLGTGKKDFKGAKELALS